jgi:dihydrofolate synthase/folylpolyglutamate synthase
MSYPDSVQYLYALGNELKAGAKFGLERMQTLMTALGESQLATRTVHVAGTNGKGSTSAMIASALRAAGYKTGLYTSPHLISPTERIQMDGLAITPADFDAVFQKVHAVAERLVESGEMDAHPSYFETITAMAFVYFQTCCQWSVIEVGLGGRLDATNVVQPELCVITPIGFDHEAYLGNTLEAIAAEKAGILKRGVPVVVAPQPREAEGVILERAQALGCEVIRANEADSVDVTAYGSAFEMNGIRYSHSLPGRHQIVNAASAILACRRLGLAEPAIQQGLREARWPGRLQLISRSPDLVLDGAHNPAGAAALAAYIREFHADRPVWIIYGAMRDKAIDEVASALFPLADRLIVTAPAFPRALRPQSILALHPHANSTIAETVGEAICIAQGAPANAIVFFTGSLFLVGEVLGAI